MAKRIRTLSTKRAAEKRKIDPERKAFLEENPVCWVCCFERATEIHEMTPGAGRRAGYQERCTWIATCRKCHREKLQPFRFPWDLAGQLAVKAITDHEYYDRLRVLAIKGLAPTAVTELEVIDAVFNLVAARARRV